MLGDFGRTTLLTIPQCSASPIGHAINLEFVGLGRGLLVNSHAGDGRG